MDTLSGKGVKNEKGGEETLRSTGVLDARAVQMRYLFSETSTAPHCMELRKASSASIHHNHETRYHIMLCLRAHRQSQFTMQLHSADPFLHAQKFSLRKNREILDFAVPISQLQFVAMAVETT